MARLPKPPRPHTLIYTDDLKKMRGPVRSMRTAYRILQQIRQHYGKPPDSDVTVEEYCTYMQTRRYEIQPVINKIRMEEEIAYYSKVSPTIEMLKLRKRWTEQRIILLCILVLALLIFLFPSLITG